MFRTVLAAFLFIIAGILSAAGQQGQPPAAGAARTAGPPAVTYQVFLDGESKGPFTLDELRAMAAEGKLHAGIFVWKVGLVEWTLANAVPEVAAFVPAAPAPAPESEPAPAVAYYLEVGGEAKGPYSLDDISAMIDRGEVTALSPVWKEGLASWKTAAGVEEIAALLPAVAAPGGETGTPAPGDEQEASPADEEALPPPDSGVAEVAPGEEVAPPAAEATPPAETTPPPEVVAAPPAVEETPPAEAPPPAVVEETPPPVVVVPPAEPHAGVRYFVAVGERSTGPFSFEDMKAKVEAGEVQAATQIWKKGMEAWGAAATVTEIAALIAERPAAPPFDCTGYLIGIWEKSTMIAGNRVTMRIAYEANGLYSGIQSTAGPYGPLTINFYGKWTATAIGDKTCSVENTASYPTIGTSTGIFEVVDRHLATDKSDNGQWHRIQ